MDRAEVPADFLDQDQARHREPLEKRELGGMEGQFRMSPDFDDEDEELIELIENSKIFPDET